MAGYCQRWFGEERIFPYGTLAVNLLDCLLIGLLSQLFGERLLIRPEIRMALTVGLPEGFTTFSTFGLETYALLADREWWSVAMNIFLSVFLGLLAVWIGDRLGSWLF